MQRRNFLHLSSATVASVMMPLGNAFALPMTASPIPTFPLEALQRNTLVVVSGVNQATVNEGFKALVEARAARGERVSVLAEEALSGNILAPRDGHGEIWLATNLVPWLEEEHHLQKRAETRLWARLREEPDAIAVQHFSDGCKFGTRGNDSEKYDLIAQAFMTGHSVITGLVANNTSSAAGLFANSVVEYQYRHDIESIYFFENGRDQSQEFRKMLLSAWSRIAHSI